MPISQPPDDQIFRRVKDHIPLRVWIVAVVIFLERAAFWGITAPWQNYMQNPQHVNNHETPGALGLGQPTATRIYCLFYIFYYSAPIFVAVLSDGRLSRYNLLVISTALYCIGCTVLTVSAIPSRLNQGWGIPGLAVSMVFIGIGAAGFRVVTVPFMVDQCQQEAPSYTTAEHTVSDYELTVQFICSLYFWVGNVGSLSWFATVYIERRYGFSAAFGLALGALYIAMVCIIGGGRWYIRVPSEGSLLPTAGRMLMCACKHGFRLSKTHPAYQEVFHKKKVPWSGQLVAELSQTLQASRVLLAFVTFYVCFDQMQNNLISQAGQIRTSGTPNDLLPAMNQVGCIVFSPIISLLIYPQLHQHKLYPTPVMRITIGFIFVTLSMVWATVLQMAIYKASPCHDAPLHCSFGKVDVWLQAPVYLLMSIGEAFALPAAVEYAYHQSPKDARVVVQAISPFVAALGSTIAMSLTSVAHDPNLVIFYASLAAAMAATTAMFWFLFQGLTWQAIPEDNPSGDSLEVCIDERPPCIDPIGDVGVIELFDKNNSIRFPESAREAPRGGESGAS